jgi:hypothetical protein
MAEPRVARRCLGGRPGIATTGLVALAAFLVLLLVLTVRLRDSPLSGAPVKSRTVIARRIYVTTVHERVVSVAAQRRAPTSSVSTSSVPAPSAPVQTVAPAATIAPVATRTSGSSTP